MIKGVEARLAADLLEIIPTLDKYCVEKLYINVKNAGNDRNILIKADIKYSGNNTSTFELNISTDEGGIFHIG